MEPTLPVFAIERHRLLTDGQGVTTLVGAYGCPLSCRYCLNPHAWNPATLRKCKQFTPHALYEKVKIDDLYIRGEYKGQMYFTDLEDAQKRLKELQ